MISTDVLARYAGDAAREVQGVSGLARDPEITSSDVATDVVVHLELAWGHSARGVSAEVQERVREYLERMAKASVGSVDVVVEGVGTPPAKQ